MDIIKATILLNSINVAMEDRNSIIINAPRIVDEAVERLLSEME